MNQFWLRPDVTAAMNFWRDPPEAASAVQSSARRFSPGHGRFAAVSLGRVSAGQRQAIARLERRPASYKSPQGNQGNYYLRKAIIKHIAITRAVACQAEDILVTSGAQQAFDLLARALVTPRETIVALEDPGYPPMRVAFAAAGAKLAAVGVDDEGLIIEQLPSDVSVICVSPSHQFPLGVTMSMRRRKALIEFARERGAVIIEDDYDGEFRYEGSPLAALRTAEAADVVFYVGTFSKCMLSALRLGFIVAPGWAIKTLTAAKNCLDWHCATPVQSAVAGFIAEGHLTRHVRKMRDTLQAAPRAAAAVAAGGSRRVAGADSVVLRHARCRAGAHCTGISKRVVRLEPRTRVKTHTLNRDHLVLLRRRDRQPPRRGPGRRPNQSGSARRAPAHWNRRHPSQRVSRHPRSDPWVWSAIGELPEDAALLFRRAGPSLCFLSSVASDWSSGSA